MKARFKREKSARALTQTDNWFLKDGVLTVTRTWMGRGYAGRPDGFTYRVSMEVDILFSNGSPMLDPVAHGNSVGEALRKLRLEIAFAKDPQLREAHETLMGTRKRPKPTPPSSGGKSMMKLLTTDPMVS